MARERDALNTRILPQSPSAELPSPPAAPRKPKKAKKRTVKTGKSVAAVGRPTVYRDEYVQEAGKLCLLGATDADMAGFFDISHSTLTNWKSAHPEFLASIKAGREQADATVADRLFKRATGYQHRAVKILAVARGNNQGSDVQEVPYIERYPPDTAAAIFWLKNRRPDLWRDKQEITVVSPDIQARLAAQADAIMTICPPDVAAALAARLTEIWTS